jgi:hypothetical protein
MAEKKKDKQMHADDQKVIKLTHSQEEGINPSMRSSLYDPNTYFSGPTSQPCHNVNQIST